MSNLTLDHFLATKREFEANMPPPMLAIKCHPATEPTIRRAMAATRAAVPSDSLLSLVWDPPIYIDATVPPGKALVAEMREVADLWRLQALMEYAHAKREEVGRLVSVLHQRLAALGAG